MKVRIANKVTKNCTMLQGWRYKGSTIIEAHRVCTSRGDDLYMRIIEFPDLFAMHAMSAAWAKLGGAISIFRDSFAPFRAFIPDTHVPEKTA